jgi:hypothetical protein
VVAPELAVFQNERNGIHRFLPHLAPMPTLYWIAKAKVIDHHRDVPKEEDVTSART